MAHVEIGTLNVIILGGGPLGGLGQKGESLSTGLVSFTKAIPGAFTPFTMGTQGWPSMNQELDLPDTESAGALILDFPVHKSQK